MKKLLVSLLVGGAALAATTVPAFAVDGFSQPTYSPNSDPVIHQTESCNPLTTPAGNPCSRWVRVGGTFMQGPWTQMEHELPLIDTICTGTVKLSSTQYIWQAPNGGLQGFCAYAGTGHGGPWAYDK